MFRSHKISTTSGFNNVLPCSIRRAVPRIPVVVAPPPVDPEIPEECIANSEAMSSVQNSLLNAVVDLLSNKHNKKETAAILTELEQTLLTKCVDIVSATQTTGSTTPAKCC